MAPAADPVLAPEQLAALAGPGFLVAHGLFAGTLLEQLAARALSAQRAGLLRPAAIGAGAGARLVPAVRGDRIAWLDAGGDPLDAAFLSACDALRMQLNRSLLLGLESLEAHYALYPPGHGYARHRDRFRDDDARVVSLVAYLNPEWDPADGGALRLHTADGEQDVLPRLGTSVLFLSAEIEHEVLPARRERLSVAGWFRRRPLVR